MVAAHRDCPEPTRPSPGDRRAIMKIVVGLIHEGNGRVRVTEVQNGFIISAEDKEGWTRRWIAKTPNEILDVMLSRPGGPFPFQELH